MSKFRSVIALSICAVLMAATLCLTVGQMIGTTAYAGIPICVGLTCWDQEDCGSKCFCNRPSEQCFEDEEGGID